MPLYEYGCGACGAVSEINHRISEPAPADCPECGKPALSKLISASNFRLKGAGWYETDFKSEGKRNLAGDNEPVEKASTTKDSSADSKSISAPAAAESKPADKSKAESKPAGKAESKPVKAPKPAEKND